MGASVMRAWERLPEAVRPWAVAGSLIGFGASVALVLVGFVGIPAKVSANTEAIAATRQDVRVLQRAAAADSVRWLRVDCLLTAIATDDDPVRRCGL